MNSSYRESIFIIDRDKNKQKVNFERWGAGEYKNPAIPENSGTVVKIYIPYLTFLTLEKAYILKRFIEKSGKYIGGFIIGYCSYSRQERETSNEPELLQGLLKTARNLLGPGLLIEDIHNEHTALSVAVPISSLRKLKNTLEDEINGEVKVVAPDKGAKERNINKDIDTHIVLSKIRKDGQVFTEVAEIKDVSDGDTLLIIDDICDGGRTFANAAEILKEKFPNSSIILAVAHAILPYGVELLKEKGIDKIITTDSCWEKGIYENGYLEVI